MTYNWVAIFGFSVFFLCWGYLLYRRGVRGLRYGLEVLSLVAGVLLTYAAFEHIGGQLGKIVFVSAVWFGVAVLWIRQSRRVNQKVAKLKGKR